MADRKEEKKEEIRKLRERLEKLEKEMEEEDASKKKENKKYLRVLVLLIVIIILVDAVSLIAYYKPDLSGLIKFNIPNNDSANSGECSDGTLEGSCSKNKPFFCYEGELLKNAKICGCPESYELDFQDCVRV